MDCNMRLSICHTCMYNEYVCLLLLQECTSFLEAAYESHANITTYLQVVTYDSSL